MVPVDDFVAFPIVWEIEEIVVGQHGRCRRPAFHDLIVRHNRDRSIRARDGSRIFSGRPPARLLTVPPPRPTRQVAPHPSRHQFRLPPFLVFTSVSPDHSRPCRGSAGCGRARPEDMRDRTAGNWSWSSHRRGCGPRSNGNAAPVAHTPDTDRIAPHSWVVNVAGLNLIVGNPQLSGESRQPRINRP
jgi:hypothetical protein